MPTEDHRTLIERVVDSYRDPFYGDFAMTPGLGRPVLKDDRFWQKALWVPGGHWEWRAGLDRGGYPIYSFAGSIMSARRYAWWASLHSELVKAGYSPAEQNEIVADVWPRVILRMNCGVRHCVRPEHIKHQWRTGQVPMTGLAGIVAELRP